MLLLLLLLEGDDGGFFTAPVPLVSDLNSAKVCEEILPFDVVGPATDFRPARESCSATEKTKMRNERVFVDLKCNKYRE